MNNTTVSGLAAGLTREDRHAIRTAGDDTTLLSVIGKNNREEIRCSVDTYKGTRMFSTRVFFKAEDGSMRPGKQGIAIKLDKLPQFAEAVAAALAIEKTRQGQ